MKGHVDLVIYKIAYLTNDSPYCYPLVISVFFTHALPHLVTTFSTRNVTTHVLQTSGRIAPNIYLFGPAHQMFRVLPAGCLSLWSCPRGSIV